MKREGTGEGDREKKDGIEENAAGRAGQGQSSSKLKPPIRLQEKRYKQKNRVDVQKYCFIVYIQNVFYENHSHTIYTIGVYSVTKIF